MLGFSRREAAALKRLSTPWRIQRFLDDLRYDVEGRHCRSPRRVLHEGAAQCLDGAIFAAAALRFHGFPPLLLDLEAERDSDHVLAVYRSNGAWGAIALSNFSGLRSREPVYRTLRELAISFFEAYFNLRREKTLRRYSRPMSLARFDGRQWMTTEEDLWYVAEHLLRVRHYELLDQHMRRSLGPTDRRLFAAGLVGHAVKDGHRRRPC
ncbi:MAG: hypothetical protein JXO72_05650 [Vicinamibacteria bacterium]|nr:hypothetical protein [Vicinamibacteria bacterium]